MRNLLQDGAILCADNLWRWNGEGKPIGWIQKPGIIVIGPDNTETKISECKTLSDNVYYRNINS